MAQLREAAVEEPEGARAHVLDICREVAAEVRGVR
jgi:hypothetical protein